MKLDQSEQDAIKGFVAGGGTVLFDAAGGDERFSQAAWNDIENIYGGGSLHKVALTSPLYNADIPDGKIETVRYRTKTAKRNSGKKTPNLDAVMSHDLPMVIYSREDISNAGLVGYQGLSVDGYDPGVDVEGSAYRIMQNIVLYAINRAQQKAQPPTTAPELPEPSQEKKDPAE